MATAYPDRANTNLRGSWVRQALMTMAATFILYKVVFTDYKVRESTGGHRMAWHGMVCMAWHRVVHEFRCLDSGLVDS